MSKKSRKKQVAITTSVLLLLLIISVGVIIVLAHFNVILLKPITLQTTKITITQQAQMELDSIYTDDLQTEIASCLKGEVQDNKIIISGVQKAETIYSNNTFVNFRMCETFIGLDKNIGLIHNHPLGNCKLSVQDIETYTNIQEYGQSIMAVNCKENDKTKNVFYLLATLESEVK